MSPKLGSFTAARLAAACGVSRKRAHQWMAGVQPRVIEGRGGLVHCWEVSSLPAWLYRRLEVEARRLLYRDVAHLLFAPPEPWQPKRPLRLLAQSAVGKATARRQVLQTIFAAPDAEIVPVSVLVCRALPEFQSPAVDLGAAGERAVRRWIEAARDRDRGLCRWDRLEIYLDENPPLQTDAATETQTMGTIGGGHLEAVIGMVGDAAAPTQEEQALIWDALFRECERLTGLGIGERAAKGRLLALLNQKLPGMVPLAPSARSMTWQRRFQRWSENGCSCEAFADGRAAKDGKSTVGRKPSGYVTEEEARDIQALVRKNPSHHKVRALILYARSSKCQRAELREVILRHRKSRNNVPDWLLAAATLPPNDKLKQQGERAYKAKAFSAKRGDFEVLEDGTFRTIEAGDWWLFDDMSSNHPFWFENIMADEGDELARKQRVSICRQSLMAMDLRSGRWLGCELVGRSRDSYRAEDILRFFFRLFTIYGLPRRGIVLERGIWRCKAIVGTKEVETEIDEEGQKRVVGGLRALGIEVKHALDAKGKALIESGFRHYQNVCATVIDGLCIGRRIGDREEGMRKYIRARQGVVSPRAVDMLHIDTLSAEMVRCMDLCNEERKEGDIQNGVPNDVWDGSLANNALRPLPMEKLSIFMPNQVDRKIAGGHLRPIVNGRKYSFINAELFARLGNDYRLRVHFDASEASLGAWVFNMEPPTSAWNPEGRKVGQFLCQAGFVEDAPQHAPPGYLDDNIRHRKAYNGAVRIAFCSPSRRGQAVVSAREARDGKGNVVRIEQGATGGLHEAARPAASTRRRGGHPRSDELANLAKAERAARRSPPPAPEIDLVRLAEREREAKEAMGIFD